MKRAQLAHRKKVILTLERWEIFYDYFSLSLRNYITFGKVDLRRKMNAINSLFKACGEGNNFMNIPITSGEYESLKLSKVKNSEVKRALKNIKKEGKKQKFRNLEVLFGIMEQLEIYREDLEGSRAIRKLMKMPYLVGLKVTVWRDKRLAEIEELIKKIKNAIKYSKSGYFINEIDSYIDSYIDFFETVNQKLLNMNLDIRNSLSEYNEIIDATIMMDKDKKCCLKLPSWNLLEEGE